MTTTFILPIYRHIRFFLIALFSIVPYVVQGADAVICTNSSDGSVSSLMGSDFDPDTRSGAKGPYYNMGSMFKNTPKGIMIFPDEVSKVQYCNNYSGTLHSYDGNPEHYDYDWLKANNSFDKYTNKYICTDSLRKLFPKGRGLPFSWKDGTNSFYVTSANPRGSLCGIWFPWDLFRGRKFTLSYRFYIIEADSTKLGDTNSNFTPSFGVGGHNSSGGYSGVSIKVKPDYDDAVVVGGGNGLNLLEGAGLYQGSAPYTAKPTELTYFKNNFWVHEFPCPWDKNTTFQHVMPRVDMGYTITYDIDFVNYGTGSFDCLLYYPYLNVSNANQWRIVIDYINVAMEHLCVDRDSVCPGKTFNITSIDYPQDAVLEWQYCVNGDTKHWVPFDTTVVSKQASVPFTVPSTAPFLTQYTFRTRQIGGTYNNDVNVTGGYSLDLTVTVASAMQCAPPDPEIKVTDMCAGPSSWGASQPTQKIEVTNSTDVAVYAWTLLSPSGKNVSNYLEFDDVKDPNHATVVVRPDESSEEGQYTVKVFGRTGTNTDASTKTMTYKFSIYQWPRINLNVYDADDNKTNTVCPSALKDLKYTAEVSPVSGGDAYKKYEYAWTYATPVTGAAYTAKVDVGAQASAYCDGSLDKFRVTVVANNHGCTSSSYKDINVTTPADPVVNCSEVVIPTLNLSATAVDTTYTFPVPTANAQCGENLVVDISIAGPKGTVPVSKSADGKKATATFPLGKSEITFSTVDDCGRKNSCKVTVLVKDVSAPRLNCDEIPNYTTYLSSYNACEATPGAGTKPADLPVLTAPVLEDLDHPGDKITGVFESRSDLAPDLNTPFQVGKTTIVWKFSDASGNTSKCTQVVVVINDRKPTMDCQMPDGVLTVTTDADQCGAYSDSLIQRIGTLLGTTPLPTATNACKPLTPLTPHLYYTVDGGAEKEFVDGIKFEVDKTYTLIWRFFNNDGVSSDFIDGKSFDECKLKFVIKDQQKPVVSCTNTTPVIVGVNYYTTNNWGAITTTTADYASGKAVGPATPGATWVYTLKGKFDNVPTASDACAGDLTPKVYISIGDKREEYKYTTKKALVDYLEGRKFEKNTTTFISFVFADDAGNKDSCTTQVTVVDRTAPVPDCWKESVVKLDADAKCQATTDLFAFKNLPTASLSVTTQTTVNMGFGPGMTSSSTAEYTIYPVKIVRQHYSVDADGEEVLDKTTECLNDGTTTVVPLTQTQSGWATTVETSTKLQTGNYKVAPACLNTTFKLGKTVITLYFANGQGDTSRCEATVTVEDVTPPTIDCGAFASTGTTVVNLPADKCELTLEELGLSVPSLTDLNASDNCTATEDLYLSYSRTYNGTLVGGLVNKNTVFGIGTNVLTWIVSDASGNASTCINSFEIKDVTGPEYDCNLKDITGYVDEKCEVSYADLIKEGLIVPTTNNDACSPVGTSPTISAVGTRSDGKALTDPYTKDASPIVITWTFTDAAGNKTTCDQNIIIKDTIAPVFDKCDDLKDLVYYLEPGQCTIAGDKVKEDLGDNNATDNCDGVIAGVPGVGDKGASPLPTAFPVGTTKVVWVFADASGIATYCYQNVIVNDTISPDTTDVCPKKLFSVDAVAGTCQNTVDLPSITLNDLCDGPLLGAFTRSDKGSLKPTDPFPTGYTTVTWTFTDKSNNQSTCTSQVYVKDVDAPVLYCYTTVNDSLLFSMTADECGTSAEKVVPQLQVPYAFDECEQQVIDEYTSQIWYMGVDGKGTPVMAVDNNGNPVAWDDVTYIYKAGISKLYFIFSDSTGNTDTCKYTIIIRDVNPPYIDCDKIVSPYALNPADGECDVAWASVDLAALNSEKAKDHCTDELYDGLPINMDGGTILRPSLPTSLTSGDTLGLWWYYITTTGGIARCPQYVTVVDNQKPVPDCSALTDMTLTAEPGKCEIKGDSIYAMLLPYPKATDNCGEITGVPSRSDGLEIDAAYPTGKTVVTWTFSDSNPENDVFCSQEIFVKGSMAPAIDCDTFKTFLDTIPECATRTFDVRIPYGNDVCAPDSLKAAKGVGVRSDGADLNAAYPLGNTIITWTFTDFTNSVSSSCSDTVNVRTKLTLEMTCKDTVVPAEEGECSKTIEIEQPVAKHPCLDVTVPGVPYIGGTQIPVADGKLSYNFRAGVTKLIWVFTDTTNSLVRDKDTCVMNVQIGNTNEMPVNCDNYPAIRKALVGTCSVDASELNFNDPEVKDLCTGQIIPVRIYRTSAPTVVVDSPNLLGSFSVGKQDTIVRLYIFQSDGQLKADTMLCRQPVWILDSLNIKTNCLPDDSITVLTADAGECVMPTDALLDKIGTPVATDECLDHDIPGVPTLVDGGTLPTSVAVGDTITIRWMFNDPLANADTAYCYQKVTVMSDAVPIFDCSTLDTLHFTANGECSIDLEPTDIPVPVAKDGCAENGAGVPGVGSRADGGEIDGVYNVGPTIITWTFKSLTSSGVKTCPQVVWVKTDKEIDAKCNMDNYPDIKVDIADGSCVVDASGILAQLTEHEALNPCNDGVVIKGVPSRSDDRDLNDEYPMGNTTIIWTFTDTTNTLVTPVSTCEQQVIVGDENKPVVDCPTSFPNVTLYLSDENCDLDFAAIPVHLDSLPINPCSGERAVLDTLRASGKGMHDPYTVGNETITWRFVFKATNQQVVCKQEVEVVDTVAPSFDCSALADTIEVAITKAGSSVTYSDVVAAGFVIPQATDKCTEVITSTKRSDGLDVEDNYQLGNTVVTFIFSDIYNNSTTCTQVVKVVDMVEPKVTCPNLTNNRFACLTDTVPAYATYEEFKAAGGSIDDEAKVDLSTFRHTNEVVGDECETKILRNYYFTTVTGVEVSCEVPQQLYVKDSIAPTYVGIPSSGASYNTSCDALEIEPLVVTAEDNCDPNPVVTYTSYSTQGSDPSQCDYYTYDVVYTYVATDRCGNQAAPVTYTVHVKDTVAPIVHTPSDWKDVMHPLYLKNCNFGIPDITALIPSDSVFQNCGNNQYLTYWQEPAAGTLVTQTTVVKLHITDVCGNDAVLEKTVVLQERKEIISITIGDDTRVCGDDVTIKNPRSADNNLASNTIRRAKGVTWAQDWDGSWTEVPTTITWDYYRGSVDLEHLVYSQNVATYSHLFEPINYNYDDSDEKKAAADAAYVKYMLLLRQTQSDVYWFVAMDTVSGCTDTASAYIDVRERPRINLTSGEWKLCEGDSLALKGDFGNTFAVCTDDMGTPIYAEGWMLNDTTEYLAHMPIDYDGGAPHSVYYYATNACGTSTSHNTLYLPCGEAFLTHEDSLAYFGSEEAIKLANQDKLYTDDSVSIEVYTHYLPSQVLLTSDPQDKARIWRGEDAELILTLPYTPAFISWRRVEGVFDAPTGSVYDAYGTILKGVEDDDVDLYIEQWNQRDTSVADSVFIKDHLKENVYRQLVTPSDSSVYYVVVSNGVCPAVASNLVSLDVLNQLPTAITPYDRDGLNDEFMRGHHVIIFNRYGQMIYEGEDGWDGTYRGILADPGVYYYSCDIQNVVYKGSIEVVKIQ